MTQPAPETAPRSLADSGADVRVAVNIAAEVATVWKFLSDPKKFAAWIGCFGGQAPLPGTKVDCRVGGAISIEYPGGIMGVGSITTIEPMKRVAFTFGCESAGNQPALALVKPGSTTIEVSLEPIATGTRVTLVHRGLPESLRADHVGGWTHYLSMLSKQAADEQFAGLATRHFESYFRAWNEPDAAARNALLEDCCEPTTRFRSSFAVADSLDEFKNHIANALKHMPGASLQALGPPQHLHGLTRVKWTISFNGGPAVMTGENVAIFSPTGKFAAMVSFGDPPGK